MPPVHSKSAAPTATPSRSSRTRIPSAKAAATASASLPIRHKPAKKAVSTAKATAKSPPPPVLDLSGNESDHEAYYVPSEGELVVDEEEDAIGMLLNPLI